MPEYQSNFKTLFFECQGEFCTRRYRREQIDLQSKNIFVFELQHYILNCEYTFDRNKTFSVLYMKVISKKPLRLELYHILCI